MNVRSLFPQFIAGVIALAATAAVATATTITYFGDVAQSINDPSQVGDAWQMTVVLPDPLVDTSSSPQPGDYFYAPTSVVLTIGGVDRTAGLYFGWSFEGLYGYQGRYGNGVTGNGIDPLGTQYMMVGLGLASNQIVTAPNGLLLPGVAMTAFDTFGLMVWGMDQEGMYGVGGNVTGYTVQTGDPIAETPVTILLLGLGLSTFAAFQRRMRRAHATS